MRVYNELQRFNQWWMILIQIVTVAFLIFSLYTWYISGENIGNVSSTDITGQIIVVVSTLITIILINILKLRTEIDEIGIHYQFFPFHLNKKTVEWSSISECYVRKYHPIKEYGGWGYRVSRSMGKAYNVKGNMGIQLTLKNRDNILIGTQKEEEAAAIITRYCNRKNEINDGDSRRKSGQPL